MCIRDRNTPDLALLDLEEAAKLAPDDAEIYVMCGEIYLSQKKKREAYVAFEKGQCFEGVQRGSLIILSARPRPQAATPALRPGVHRSPV